MASKKHRKLFFDPPFINVTAFCQPYCEPMGDGSRICPPLICKKTCPYTCTNPFPSLIPPLKPPPPPPPTATNHQKTLLQNGHLYLIISLSVLAVLCFIFSTYTIYKYYTNRNRGSPPQPPLPQDENDHTHDQFLDEEHGPVLDHPIWYIRTVGLQQSAINAITILRYKKGDGLVEGTECSVCLNEFQEDETLRLLPKCNHAFHLPCIDTWLRSHTNCPMCRAGIVTDTPAPQARPVRAPPVPEADPAIREEDQAAAVVVGENSMEEVEERGFVEEEDETSSEEDVVGKVQPMRRSVSLDCLSASMISTAIANESSGDTKLVKLKDLGGSSMGEPILMKRSVSCSGDVLMKKSTARSQN